MHFRFAPISPVARVRFALAHLRGIQLRLRREKALARVQTGSQFSNGKERNFNFKFERKPLELDETTS